MSDSNWDRLQDLFEQAVKLPEAERGAFLDDACGDDLVMRAELAALLAADRDNVTASPSFGVLAAADSDMIGSLVDGWRLLERIGVGGMGSVYLAERADGEFEQRVALKIVKKGMDTDSVVERFRQERQILARLNHPNIAGLVDGGVTEDGRPYFAMEYVDGVPITDYCDEQRQTLDERLVLFQQACDAVHYAHRSLVVHRDLKPSNIMVTAEGELKLLDFGIAKLLDESADPHLTRTGMQVHTPAYAAPEQLTNDNITTATDVYALGIVLFELLSGRRPFEVKRTPSELRELVLTGDPPKPSTAVTQLPADTGGRDRPESLEAVGAARGARVERLKKMLAGDLDKICLMAMHREPDHRYPSADQMAADIRRHLGGLPIVASPDSMTYRIGKFYRRHRAAVISTIGAIVAFTTLSVFYTNRLAEERDFALEEQAKANEVVDFVTGLFEVSNPSEARGEEVSARDLLDAGATTIDNELAERPGVQSMMRRVLGEVYYSLGAWERAQELVEAALEQQRALHGDEHLETATSKILLGFFYQDAADFDNAEPLYLEALATRRALLGSEHKDVIESLNVLAFLYESRGDFDKAEPLYVEAVEMAKRLFGTDHDYLAESMTNLAGLYRVLDRNDEAEPILRDALAMQLRLHGDEHPEIDDTKRQIAGLLRDTGRLEESKRLYEEVIASRERMLGPDHIELAHVWNSYSQLLTDMGEIDAAVAANRTFVEILERAFDGPHPSLGAAYHNRASILYEIEDYDGALDFYRQSIAMQDAVELPPRHPNRAYPRAGIAAVYLRQSRFAEAERALVEILDLRRENYPEEHVLVSETKSALGAALTGLGRFDEAGPLLTEAYGLFELGRGADDTRTMLAAERLLALYEANGDESNAARFRAILDP